MPENKKTCELTTQAVHGRLQPFGTPPRAARNSDRLEREDITAAPVENSLGGFAVPREIILRLIDWLKEEQ